MSSISLEPVRETNLPNRLYTGKVRDTYDMGQGLLLMVATDRISAFDVVLPTAVPTEGHGAVPPLGLLVREDGPYCAQPPSCYGVRARQAGRPG